MKDDQKKVKQGIKQQLETLQKALQQHLETSKKDLQSDIKSTATIAAKSLSRLGSLPTEFSSRPIRQIDEVTSNLTTNKQKIFQDTGEIRKPLTNLDLDNRDALQKN